MALKVTKADIWAASIEDRAGGAADRLEALSKAGANLEMLLGRRTEQPGQGVMFVTPVKGARAVKGAQAAGFSKPQNIHSVRIEGGDKPGLGARIARAGRGRRELSRHIRGRHRAQVHQLHCLRQRR